MDIQKFVRRSFAVRGVQVTVENINEVAEWSGGSVVSDPLDSPIFIQIEVQHALNERQKQAHVGDWVLNTKKGFKVYTDRAFKANFKAEGDGERTTTKIFNVIVPEGSTKADYVLAAQQNLIRRG